MLVGCQANVPNNRSVVTSPGHLQLVPSSTRRAWEITSPVHLLAGYLQGAILLYLYQRGVNTLKKIAQEIICIEFSQSVSVNIMSNPSYPSNTELGLRRSSRHSCVVLARRTTFGIFTSRLEQCRQVQVTTCERGDLVAVTSTSCADAPTKQYKSHLLLLLVLLQLSLATCSVWRRRSYLSALSPPI